MQGSSHTYEVGCRVYVVQWCTVSISTFCIASNISVCLLVHQIRPQTTYRGLLTWCLQMATLSSTWGHACDYEGTYLLICTLYHSSGYIWSKGAVNLFNIVPPKPWWGRFSFSPLKWCVPYCAMLCVHAWTCVNRGWMYGIWHSSLGHKQDLMLQVYFNKMLGLPQNMFPSL